MESKSSNTIESSNKAIKNNGSEKTFRSLFRHIIYRPIIVRAIYVSGEHRRRYAPAIYTTTNGNTQYIFGESWVANHIRCSEESKVSFRRFSFRIIKFCSEQHICCNGSQLISQPTSDARPESGGECREKKRERERANQSLHEVLSSPPGPPIIDVFVRQCLESIDQII